MKNPCAALCAALLFLAGCGGSSKTTSQVNGNYALQGTVAAGGNIFFGGGLQNSGGSIKGVFHVLDTSNCISSTVQVPVTGSVSGSTLHLTSSTVVSQTYDIAGTISSDGATITAGTYKVTGGCAAGQGGTVSGFRVADISGAYAGNLTVQDVVGNPTNTQIATTANLTQSSSLDSNGYFTVSGPLTFNSPCFTGFAIASSQIFGTEFLLVATPGGVAAGASVPTLTITGYATDATAKQISGHYSTANVSAACTTSGFVLLTHP